MSDFQNRNFLKYEVKLGLLEKSIKSSFFYNNKKRTKYHGQKYYIKNFKKYKNVIVLCSTGPKYGVKKNK